MISFLSNPSIRTLSNVAAFCDFAPIYAFPRLLPANLRQLGLEPNPRLGGFPRHGLGLPRLGLGLPRHGLGFELRQDEASIVAHEPKPHGLALDWADAPVQPEGEARRSVLDNDTLERGPRGYGPTPVGAALRPPEGGKRRSARARPHRTRGSGRASRSSPRRRLRSG